MRPDEIEQYVALTNADFFDPDVAARGLMNIPGVKFTLAARDGFPIVSGGYQEVNPGVWLSWMVGSMDGWDKHWRSITKATRWLMDGLLAEGARRLETVVLSSRTKTIEWYERSLGMEFEGKKRAYCRDGQDLSMYVRLAEGL